MLIYRGLYSENINNYIFLNNYILLQKNKHFIHEL